MTLADPHRVYPDSVLWTVTDAGVGINGLAPVGTPGEPLTVRRCMDWFGPQIAAAADAHGVPAALIVACLCAESVGGAPDRDTARLARREEPGWVSDDATPGRVSVGCMQTLLSTASAMLGRDVTTDDLADPAVSIDAGARYIQSLAFRTHMDPPCVAAAYNAGGLYYEPAPANRWRLRCYPLGTGAHVDRFVAFYNDAVRVGVI